MEELHLIQGDANLNLLFHPPTYSMFSVNDEVFAIVKRLKQTGVAQTAKEFGCLEQDIVNFIESLNGKIKENKIKDIATTTGKSKSIDRITLHISNDCNLRCKYCYANGGSYNQPRDLMSKETAQAFVEFCCDNFENIGHIVFFGGEPMLNVKVMDFICNQFNERFKTNKISYLPKFGIITNGTIINTQSIVFIKQHIAFITVSIDGPKYLNDYNRVFPSGNGSYEKISTFIKTVKKASNVHLRYEATYTKYHQKHNISREYLKTFFWKEFGINGEIIDELSLSSSIHEEYWSLFHKNILSDIDIENLPEGFSSIISSIIEKRTNNMCQLARNICAISTTGDIYPCHINTGEPHLSLGNISQDNIFNNPNMYTENFPLYSKIHKKNIICKDCWARNICGGCSIKWFYDENTKNYLPHPKPDMCKSSKKHIERILLLIAQIRKNPKTWSSFVEIFNNKFNSMAV